MNELQNLNRKQMGVYVITTMLAGMAITFALITAITLIQSL